MEKYFIRQRRNIIISSLLILSLCLGKVKILKLSVAGISFNAFDKPEMLLVFIWASFLYFSYRYIIYLIEFSPSNIKKIWDRELARAVNPKIEEIVRERYPEMNEACLYEYSSLRKDQYIYSGQAYKTLKEEPDKPKLENFKLYIPASKLLLKKTQGFIRFLLVTPAVSEYFFPILLSFFTLIYCGIIDSWEGNLFKLFT